MTHYKLIDKDKNIWVKVERFYSKEDIKGVKRGASVQRKNKRPPTK